METLAIWILLAIVIAYFLLGRNSADKTDIDPIEADFICDECNERECICHEKNREE